jgi:hypothetical protein
VTTPPQGCRTPPRWRRYLYLASRTRRRPLVLLSAFPGCAVILGPLARLPRPCPPPHSHPKSPSRASPTTLPSPSRPPRHHPPKTREGVRGASVGAGSHELRWHGRGPMLWRRGGEETIAVSTTSASSGQPVSRKTKIGGEANSPREPPLACIA